MRAKYDCRRRRKEKAFDDYSAERNQRRLVGLFKDVKHEPNVLLPWIHMGHGCLMAFVHRMQRYLDEFVFRFNRRRTPQAANLFHTKC